MREDDTRAHHIGNADAEQFIQIAYTPDADVIAPASCEHRREVDGKLDVIDRASVASSDQGDGKVATRQVEQEDLTVDGRHEYLVVHRVILDGCDASV